MVRKKLLVLGMSLIGLLTVLDTIALKYQAVTQESSCEHFIYPPSITRASLNLLDGDEFYIGQRSSSLCAEHDSYVVPVATAINSNMIPVGTELMVKYRINATHPVKEVHPLGAPWQQWCDADWTNCPNSQQSGKFASKCDLLDQSGDTITKVFDNVQEQIYVLDGAADIGTFEVIVNGQSFGQYSGVVFGSRWGSAQSWNHDGVIYANGFTRWKPKGEEPGAETDPCFGTSVILGPFQIDEPFLSDGYNPNPLRHPKVETINITAGTGWEVQMFGAFVEEEHRLMNVSWLIKRLNISSSEILISVAQNAITIQDVPLYQIQGQYGIGQAAMSSMYADPEKHDSDTQIGPGDQTKVEDISYSNEGLWGQETYLHQLPEGYALYLETTTSTTHNTGSPTLRILWDSLLKDDLLGTWTGQGVYYRNSDTGSWVNMATPATQIAAGDIDNDGIDDLLGIWPAQGGVWVKYSSPSSWAQLSSTADWIAAGDMNGDSRSDFLGTWSGQGVYYKNLNLGIWVQMASPATQIAAGDIDNDGIDDLLGIWPGQGGVWVKSSGLSVWAPLSSTADWIATGDMNGDNHTDLLGSWSGQGVYYRNSATGDWVLMSNPATQIAAGDFDGDGTDDLLGIWPGQGGVWVKYSSDSTWEQLSSTADWIAAGKMREAGSGSSGAIGLAGPFGGLTEGPDILKMNEGLLNMGPGGSNFLYKEERNLIPIDQAKMGIMRAPGPGEPGFICFIQKNLVPHEEVVKKREKK